jgi:hypothetical protein
MTYIRRTRSKVAPVDSDSEINGNRVEAFPPPEQEERVKQFVKRHPTQDLGWCFARYNEESERLTIASPPDYSQTPEIPGQFLEIQGKPNIHSLLHFIKRVLYPNQEREPRG